MKIALCWSAVVGTLTAGLSVGAIAHQGPENDTYPVDPTPWRQADQRVAFGVVTRMESVRVPASNGNPGAGALLGGAIGAVVGRQVGGGSDGRAAATLVGAVVGAIAGHHLEKRQSIETLRISVRLDNGQQMTFEQSQAGDLRVGQRVQIENDRLIALTDGRHDRRWRGDHDRRIERRRDSSDDWRRYREHGAELQSPLI